MNAIKFVIRQQLHGDGTHGVSVKMTFQEGYDLDYIIYGRFPFLKYRSCLYGIDVIRASVGVEVDRA